MCGAWGRSADGDLRHAVWASADSADRHPAQGLPCETICRRKRTHSLASVLLTLKIKGLPSAVACSLTTDSFQPMRVFAKKIDSIARGLPCETICRTKRTHSLASVLLTSKIKGLPSALACSLTTVSFQPIRVFAKKIDSIARDESFLIGCVPAGGVIPKIFAAIKLPIRACS